MRLFYRMDRFIEAVVPKVGGGATYGAAELLHWVVAIDRNVLLFSENSNDLSFHRLCS